MKHLIVILLVFGLTATLPAGEDHEHGHSHTHIVVPPTLAAVRAEIAAQQETLSAKLSAGDAAAAHAATDALAACVKAIPGMVAGLDETSRRRIEGMANNAAKAWGQAAHDADHGDYDKAGREAAKGNAAYRLLEARLPSE